MKKIQRGFTLIELMIVVAIIGILAAIAIPSYQDYTARAQVSEAVTLLGGFKTGLAEYYQAQSQYPSGMNLTAIGDTTSGKYVGSMSLRRNATRSITVFAKMGGGNARASNSVTGKQLTLQSTDGGRTWICGETGHGTDLEPRHRPSGCKGS